jgi:TRAP-type uncharacterized transport system fused permease subunit
LSVYLLATFYHTKMVIDRKARGLDWRDKANIGAFVFVVGGLISLMATIHLAPMFAALYMFVFTAIGLLVIHVGGLVVTGRWSLSEFLAPMFRFLDSYIDMIVDISLLLATLSIMTGALVITGVPTKLGSLLVDAAGINLAAMVAMAFVFGAILGTGLPPAPVYILVAIVIAGPFIKVGVNPWVVHFFAFFIGVFGELTPPTSITAAITSKIANASFYTTLWRSVQICVSLFTLMIGVFVHPDLVIAPGLNQMAAAYLVLVATVGITFTLQGTYSETRAVDLGARGVLAAMSLYILFSFNDVASTIVSIGVLAMIGYWFVVRRPIVAGTAPEVVEFDSSLTPAPASNAQHLRVD